MTRFAMIGHSTVLIEAAGKRVLTDPYFGPAFPHLAQEADGP